MLIGGATINGYERTLDVYDSAETIWVSLNIHIYSTYHTYIQYIPYIHTVHTIHICMIAYAINWFALIASTFRFWNCVYHGRIYSDPKGTYYINQMSLILLITTFIDFYTCLLRVWIIFGLSSSQGDPPETLRLSFL